MEKKNDRNKNTSQNKLYSDEIKEMEKDYTEADKEKDDANSSKLIELAKKEADCVGDDRRK